MYRDIGGKPCLVGTSETVGLDLELIAFARRTVPPHTFITRHLGDNVWVIAANARRMPVPGWPPTEQELSGLLLDCN